jgi:hypothetical protein
MGYRLNESEKVKGGSADGGAFLDDGAIPVCHSDASEGDRVRSDVVYHREKSPASRCDAVEPGEALSAGGKAN